LEEGVRGREGKKEENVATGKVKYQNKKQKDDEIGHETRQDPAKLRIGRKDDLPSAAVGMKRTGHTSSNLYDDVSSY